MKKETLQKAQQLEEERCDLNRKIILLNDWIQSIEERRCSVPIRSTHIEFEGEKEYAEVSINQLRFIYLLQIERTELQARLNMVEKEFTNLVDDHASNEDQNHE